jgi:hypothetical protein
VFLVIDEESQDVDQDSGDIGQETEESCSQMSSKTSTSFYCYCCNSNILELEKVFASHSDPFVSTVQLSKFLKCVLCAKIGF